MDELLGKHFIPLFLVILFALRLSTQRSVRDKELNYFWLTLVCSFLLVFEDLFEAICSRNPDLRFWRTLLSVAGYVLRSVAAGGLLFAVLKPARRNWMYWIPAAVNLLICSTAFFSDIAFGFDEEYAFYRGPLGYVPFIVPLGYLAAILWIAIRRYGDRERIADRVSLTVCALLCLSAALLDAAYGGVRLHSAILISSIFFYLFLRSYDVRRDSLTGLLNRQSLFEDCRTLRKSISAAASLDMNGLKKLNDREGFSTGDEALKEIGACLSGASGKDIRAYRIGGDEFILLFLACGETRVEQSLAEILESAARRGFSLSCGYAMRAENEDTSLLIARADAKMFEDKARYYRNLMKEQRPLRESRREEIPEEARSALEESPLPAAVYRFGNHTMEVLAVSEGFCELFGYPGREEAVSVLDNDLYRDIHPDDRERLSGARFRFSEGSEELDIVFRSRTAGEKGYRVIHARGKHLRTEAGMRTAHVWYMDEGAYSEEQDGGSGISQVLNNALHEESIIRAAQYDRLTGLPNLAHFFQLSDMAKAKAGPNAGHGVLLYLDLYGMRFFNGTYGFAEGDKLLKAFADLLAQMFGKQNCCHVSADCFAAGAKEDGIEARLKELFAEAEKINGGKSLPVRVGIYSSRMEDAQASTAYDRAKTACDSIRKSSVSAYHYYSTELRDEVRLRQYLVMNIDRAVAEGWIQVYYQPIVRSVSGKVCDEEALARWNDPREGFLSPESFIPLLEQAGLIYRLDLYMLEQVLKKLRRQMEMGQDTVPHSINLSRSDFETCDIVEEVRKRVDGAGLPRSLITVEITESVIGRNFAFMRRQIERFQALGFKVWMDDFGSGYSSLDVLESIPFDLIKFDMSFTRKLDEGKNGKIILTDLMRMATSLGVDTLCEGVETAEQVRFLQEIGCSKLQGYYFCKPLSYEQLLERYRKGEQIGYEDPDTSAYFESVGRVNLYSLDMIVDQKQGESLRNAFDSLPMCIMEVQGGMARYARSNPSYREFMQRFFHTDLQALGREYHPFSPAFMQHILLQQGQEESCFFEKEMGDGTRIHFFARRIGTNPKTGETAVALAVLYASEKSA